MTAPPIRIVVVDDNVHYRQTVSKILGKNIHLKIVGAAEDGLGAVQTVEKLRPDVVLMDISMPGMDAFEATRTITSKFPGTRVIMLSMYSDERLRTISCWAGACYYLCKSECSPEDILAAIREGHQPE